MLPDANGPLLPSASAALCRAVSVLLPEANSAVSVLLPEANGPLLPSLSAALWHPVSAMSTEMNALHLT